jgi:Na+-driven multidrug efflux pump
MLQNLFQSFLVTAEKPELGLKITVAAGLTNVVLDLLMIGVWRWGVAGAALATGISQMVGGVIPLIYFSRENSSLLMLVKTRMNWRVFGKTCTNGSSELMTNLSLSLVNMLYNFQLLKYAGENGVAAYGVIMYVNFIFISVYIGYAIGSAPIVGYNYGAGNHAELKNVYGKSIRFNILAGITMFLSAIALAGVLAKIFVGYDLELFEMTKRGFMIYSMSFVIIGLNIWGSAFFTALGNGLISALISFLRTLLFQLVAVLVLPLLFELDGIWMAIVVAESVALLVSVLFLRINRKKYHY